MIAMRSACDTAVATRLCSAIAAVEKAVTAYESEMPTYREATCPAVKKALKTLSERVFLSDTFQRVCVGT